MANLSARQHPLWRTYEEQVAQLITALAPSTEVIHNKRVEARLSKAARQIDVWCRGEVAGQQITVAVECKWTSRPLEIGVIDEFVGKLLDTGADKGVLYSASGMTSNAVQRASGASNPGIIPVTLQPAPGPRAPGYPLGMGEPDYADWLDDATYEELLISESWLPWYLR